MLIRYLVGKNGNVLTFEIQRDLADDFENKIKSLQIKNVWIERGNFLLIKKKFNKIIITAGIEKREEGVIENFAKAHLFKNGILVCPYRAGPMIRFKKISRQIKKEYSPEEYVFVPLEI